MPRRSARTRVARVIGGGDAGLGHARPERVEARIGRGIASARRLDRAGAHHDHARVVGERPFELAHRAVDVDERDVRRREQPLLVRKAPVFVQPAVEGAERSAQRLGIALERLLHADAERGEHEHPLEALGIHQRDARVAVAIGGVDRLEIAEHLADALAVGVAAAEVVVETTGLRDRIEGRIGDEAVDLSGDEQALAAAHDAPLHRAALHLGLDVARERVLGLVVVVVCVECREVDVRHGGGSFSWLGGAGRRVRLAA